MTTGTPSPRDIGAIGNIFRSGAAKAANNAVRTGLLRSLGKAFGLLSLAIR